METLKHPDTYVKAIWTFFTTALAQMVLVVVGDMSPADLSWAQWLTISLNTIVITGGVFGLKNEPTVVRRIE